MTEPTEKYLEKIENEFEFYKTVGGNIRAFRKKAGFTQEDLAYMLNISRVSVNNIELGKQRLPLHMVSAIGRLFKAYMYYEIIPAYQYGVKSPLQLFEYKKDLAIKALNDKLNNI